MSKRKHWLKLLRIDPIPLLLEKAPLEIRYAAYKRFHPEATEQLEKLYQQLETYAPRKKLIQSQKANGLWKVSKKYTIEERNRAITFLEQLKYMNRLLDLQCTKELPVVQKGIIALLKNQKPDGKFPLMLHHHGHTLWLLAQFDLLGNPFVEKGYRWIAKRQREDGGWLSPSMLPSGVSVKTAKSGIWTTLIVFQAFSVHSRLRNSDVSRKAAQFVLENYLVRNHTTIFPEEDAWNYLYTDYSDHGLFRGGTLRFVEALAPLEDYHDHKNFKKAIDWLIDNQLPNGLFPAISGKSREGNYGVTFRVASALKEIEEANV